MPEQLRQMIIAETALSYSNVVKIYRKSHLGRVARTTGLNGLCMAVGKGEIFGLLGLNGAGKTTAMKLALGLLFPTSGRVEIFGLDPWSAECRNRIGFLPELPYFYSFLTPSESLRFYGRLSYMDAGILETRIRETLETVGLSPHSGRRVTEFSKGMLQRLGMAQALIHNPELLILDEPVSGLDPLAVHDFRALLSGLNRKGKTIFLSSHSISEVEKLCHRVAILVNGRVAQLVTQAEWEAASGGLEEIFINAVRQ